MKIHELKQSHLMGTYLLMMFVVLLPVVLNLYAPTLMGRGLRNSIITASVLVFGVWFSLLLFTGRTASCDTLVLMKQSQDLWNLRGVTN
jgi:hypothetical protein